jgi:hypothetical protein
MGIVVYPENPLLMHNWSHGFCYLPFHNFAHCYAGLPKQLKTIPGSHCNFCCLCLTTQIAIWSLFTDTAYMFHLNRKLTNSNIVAVYNAYNTHTHTHTCMYKLYVYIYFIYIMYIYVVLREVRKSYGILVGKLNVRLLIRTRSACENQLNWTVNMRSVVRWAGFNWLLIEPSVRSR